MCPEVTTGGRDQSVGSVPVEEVRRALGTRSVRKSGLDDYRRPEPLELFPFAPCALRFAPEARRGQRISPARPSALWMTDGASIEPAETSRSISG